jgi:hypothetical protein
MMKLVDKQAIGVLILSIMLISEVHSLDSDLKLSFDSFASKIPQANVN